MTVNRKYGEWVVPLHVKPTICKALKLQKFFDLLSTSKLRYFLTTENFISFSSSWNCKSLSNESRNEMLFCIFFLNKIGCNCAWKENYYQPTKPKAFSFPEPVFFWSRGWQDVNWIVMHMSRESFVGSHSQITWLSLGQWKGSKKCQHVCCVLPITE